MSYKPGGEGKLLALLRHAKELAQASTTAEIARATLDTVKTVLGYDFGTFGLIEGLNIHFIESTGFPNFEGMSLPLDGTGITVRAVKTGETQRIDDVSHDPAYIDVLSSRLNITTRSELDVPIKIGDEVVAIINLESEKPAAFKQDDATLVELFSEHVASALDRIRVREQLLAEQARSTRDFVDGANKIAGMVRHDLRTPLQTISNATFLLRAHPEKLQELTNAIDRSVAYSDKILEDLKAMIGPTELQRTLINLNDLVEASLAQIKIPDSISVEVRHSDEFITVSLDATRIRRALDNLIKNAVEAMPGGGSLTITTTKHPSHVTVSVADTGPGIPKAESHLIFKPFHTTKKTGTGLGLTSTRQAVEAHGGTIMFESTEGKGTTFTITLPTKND